MDPVTALGAAGSVVGIAGFGIQLSQILIKFVSQVRYAQEHLEDIVAEIDSTTSALEEIYYFLKQEVRNVEGGKALNLFSESSLIKVKGTADKCLVVFWRIETTIAGSEPDGFEDQLEDRLNSFNQTLASYRPNYPIKIESQLSSDPLGLRDKVRWAFRASRLERFCKELQRYRNHLALLLQIVFLGKQQAKQNPTEEDIISMRQTYTLITHIATPVELNLMAIEAAEESERHRSRSRGPIRSTVYQPPKHPQTVPPTRSSGSKPIQRPGPERSHGQISHQPNRGIVPHSVDVNNSQPSNPPGGWPGASFHVLTQETANHLNDSFQGEMQTGNQPLVPPSVSEFPKAPPSIPAQGGEDRDVYLDHEPQGDSSAPAGKTEQTLRPLQAGLKVADTTLANGMACGTLPGAYPGEIQQQVSNHDKGVPGVQQQQAESTGPGRQTIGDSSRGQITTPYYAPDNSVPPSRAPSAVGTTGGNPTEQGAEEPSSATAPNENSLGKKPVSGPSEPSSSVHQDQRSRDQDVAGEVGTKTFPYVIQENRAYRLPISLQLKHENEAASLPEYNVAIELALLSPGQLRTIQTLLQYHGEAEPHKLVRLENAREPARKFWQRRRRVTVAFVEGDGSNMPGLLSLPVDASDQSPGGKNHLLSHVQIRREWASPRIGMPRFQDVTNDLINGIHDPWSQAADGERFTEYSIWHIKPSLAMGRRKPMKDWARSLLREELLPRAEIKRRLAILDKDPATALKKTAMLTTAQQYQVWRLIEEAKLDDPDPDYQWNIRQLEIIRSRKLFIAKQVRAIVVYLSKAPLVTPRGFHRDVVQEVLPNPAHSTSHGARRRKSVNTRRHAALQGPASSASDVSNPESEILALPTDRRGKLTRREEAIARANRIIANRPAPRLTSNFSDERLRTRIDDLEKERVRERERDREEELARKIRLLEHRINRERELEKEDERTARNIRDIERRVRSKSPDNPYVIGWDQLRTRESQGSLGYGRQPEARPYLRRPPSPEAALVRYPLHDEPLQAGGVRGAVRFREDERPDATREVTYYDESGAEQARIRYPSKFDMRRFNPRIASQPGGESQRAVEKLLLEWTPTAKGGSDDGGGLTTPVADADWDTVSNVAEDFMMAEEFPTPGLAAIPPEEPAVGDQSVAQAESRRLDVEEGGGRANGSQLRNMTNTLSLDEEDIAQEAIAAPGRGAWGGARLERISSDLQQLSGPPSKTVNDASPDMEETRGGASQTRTPGRQITREDDAGASSSQKGKNIPRAATLPPQASRQPWADGDWARQVVEETAVAMEPDRVRERSTSSYFPMSSTSMLRRLESRSRGHGGHPGMPSTSSPPPPPARHLGDEDGMRGGAPSDVPKAPPPRRQTLI